MSKSLFDLSGKVALVTGSTAASASRSPRSWPAPAPRWSFPAARPRPAKRCARSSKSRASRCWRSPATSRARRNCRRSSTRPSPSGAASTSPSRMRRPIRTTGRSREIPDEAFDKVFLNNVKSVLWLAGITLPGMAERGGGSFITVGSIGGIRANTVIGAYGMSKAADHHLVRNLAAEWGPKNVRVNAIAPGPDQDRLRQGAVGGREARRKEREANDAAAAPRRAARHRRHRGVPRLGGGRVHHRPGHRRRRRRHRRLKAYRVHAGTASSAPAASTRCRARNWTRATSWCASPTPASTTRTRSPRAARRRSR